MYPAEARHRIYGVDFSGSKTACNKIWISSGKPVGSDLHIDECYRLADKVRTFTTSPIPRDECLTKLRNLIVQEKDAIFGIDLSFSLPGPLIEEDWESFVLTFPSKYPSAEQFRESCRSIAAGRELKRSSEISAKVPFSVYNLRLYRQTYFGIRDILYPLLRDGLACIIPMQESKHGKPWLIEICPACRLKKEGIYVPYKGKEDDKRDARKCILEYFMDKGLVVSSLLQKRIVEDTEGDALDSIIAAYSTFISLPRLGEALDTFPGNYMVEGYTFF